MLDFNFGIRFIRYGLFYLDSICDVVKFVFLCIVDFIIGLSEGEVEVCRSVFFFAFLFLL